MGRFDRYILSQLLLVFGFFALVLVGVYWVNRVVILVDTYLSAGQSGFLLFEMSLLALPTLVKLVLPIAAFLAVLQTINRLFSESELVVVQATGFSGFRLARPVLMFGIVVGVLVAILAHVLVPASMSRLNAREAAIAEAASARLLVPGTFQHPIKGITVYVRDIGSDGVIADLLLSDQRDPTSTTTYSAQRALFIRDEDGPKLLMFDGLAQTFDRETGKLATTTYKDFTFAVGSLIAEPKARRLDPRQVSTPQLLRANEALQTETRRDVAWLKREAHQRVAESLLVPPLCVMAFATLMLGTFSRFGLWRQVILSILFVVVVKLVDNAAADLAKTSAELWWVLYAPSLLTAVLSAILLWLGGGRFGTLLSSLRRRPA